MFVEYSVYSFLGSLLAASTMVGLSVVSVDSDFEITHAVSPLVLLDINEFSSLIRLL